MIYFISIILLLSVLTIAEAVDRRLIPSGTPLFIFCILFFMAAFRPIGLDHDSETYILMFNIFREPNQYFSNFLVWGYFEPFYYLIPSTLKYVFGVYHFDVITLYIFAFVGCGIAMLSIRQLTNYYYAALLTLFCHFFMLQEMTQIRSAIAIGIFLFCIKLKVEKRWPLILICVGFSLLFHYSSVLAFSLFFLSDKKIKKPLWITLTVLSLALSFIDFSGVIGLLNIGDAGALTAKQDTYVTDIHETLLNRRNYIVLIHTANTLLLLFFAEKLYAKNKYIYLMAKLQVAGLLFYQVFSASPSISSRSADYLLSTHIVTLSACIYLFRYKFWPALIVVLLNTGIFFTLIYRNGIFRMEPLNNFKFSFLGFT